ncbi:hypothetical protein WP50_23950, partial [Lactiplantibacillus plantarum]
LTDFANITTGCQLTLPGPTAPAGLGLYFFVGGLFACLQTLIINFFRPRIRREVEAELKKHPIKTPTPTQPKPINATESQLAQGNVSRC